MGGGFNISDGALGAWKGGIGSLTSFNARKRRAIQVDQTMLA